VVTNHVPVLTNGIAYDGGLLPDRVAIIQGGNLVAGPDPGPVPDPYSTVDVDARAELDMAGQGFSTVIPYTESGGIPNAATLDPDHPCEEFFKVDMTISTPVYGQHGNYKFTGNKVNDTGKFRTYYKLTEEDAVLSFNFPDIDHQPSAFVGQV
jgi:hypothetical protein